MIQQLQTERAAGPEEPRILLHDISWEFYKTFGAEVRDRPFLRLTFDQGRLEIMTISSRHDRMKRFLGRLVEALTEELNIPICSIGSTTQQRNDLEKGIEADEGYYIQSEALVRHNPDLDFDHDPPPDLAIEVEVSRPAIKRLPIYAAMKVPEVWIYDGDQLHFHCLQPDGNYESAEKSRCLPFLNTEDLLVFTRQWTSADETTLVRSFRAWVRQHVLPNWKPGE